MTLCRKDRVIRLAGSPSTQQQAKLDVDSNIADADNIVYDYTRKNDWISTDFGYEWAREAAEKWAAANLLEEYQDMNNKAVQYRQEAQEALTTLRKIGYGTKDADNPSFYSAVSKYKSIALNEGVGRHLTRNFFGGEYD